MNQPLTISDEAIKLTVDPRFGGSFLNFSANIDGAWLDLTRSTPSEFKTSSDTASFLMAPYPNRIRDGKFIFNGNTYQLRFPEKHSIHGDVRNRPWHTEVARRNSATLHFDSRECADINYPFPFSVTQSFGVSNGALLVRCSIKNEGSGAMPAGCGFHPYFNRALGGRDENVRIRFNAAGVYPYSGETPLPEGMPVPLTQEQNFCALKSLDANLDHCFSGWNGEAEMVWPASKVKVSMHASSTMRHLVLYSPPGKPFFALEPQSQMNDGFNFLAKGEKDTGVAILPPGGELSVWFSLTVEKIA